jgi:hypothetical protein
MAARKKEGIISPAAVFSGRLLGSDSELMNRLAGDKSEMWQLTSLLAGICEADYERRQLQQPESRDSSAFRARSQNATKK